MTNAEKRFKKLEEKYKEYKLNIEHTPSEHYFTAYINDFEIENTYLYDEIYILDETIDVLEKDLDSFTKFNKIENKIKEINTDWYIDSFIDSNEMSINIKEINKYYITSMNFNLRLNNNIIDLSVKISYTLNNNYNNISKEATSLINNIKFDVRNELGTEGNSYYDHSSLYMESKYETDIKDIPTDNLLGVITDIIKATKENNYLLDTINYFK